MIGYGQMAGRWVVLAAVCATAASGAAQSGTAGDKARACVPVSGANAEATKRDGTSKDCPAGQHEPTVTEQFPFPGETKPVPTAPDPAKGQEGGGGKTVKDRFPYPGEPSVDARKAGGGAADRFPYPGEAGASSNAGGSSSSSSEDGDATASDGKPALKDEGSGGEAQPQHRRRLRPQAQKTLSEDERVEEDLSVAHFYQQSGNMMGAYLRAKDAVKLQPAAADTHLALATAAEKMGKREEAIAEYTAALAAEPEGEAAKGAQKALERLKR